MGRTGLNIAFEIGLYGVSKQYSGPHYLSNLSYELRCFSNRSIIGIEVALDQRENVKIKIEYSFLDRLKGLIC